MSDRSVSDARPTLSLRSWLLQRVDRAKRCLLPFAIGALLVPVGSCLINETTFADALVGPLLLSDTAGVADVIVVPAAGVTAACTPNLNAVRRTLLAARLFREGRAPLVMFSGGMPTGLKCPVARVMSELAQFVGVPAERQRLEIVSRTTWENAEFSAPQLRALQAQRVLLVTDRLHMARTVASFAHFGFDIERASVPVYEGHRDNVEMLRHGFREYAAIYYYRWLGRIAVPWSKAPVPNQALRANHLASVGIKGKSMHPIRNPGGPIVVLGASYAGGWKVETLNGVPIINKGVTGQQSFECLARFEADVTALQPRAVVLWGFINDVFRSPREQIQQSLARARASFTQMIAAARAAGIEPILATEVTIRQPNTLSSNLQTFVGGLLGKVSYQDYVNGHVLETNRWLRQFAAEEGLLLLDFQPALSDGASRRRKAFAIDDGSHISQAGYQVLTNYANEVLKEQFR